jgi:TPR repeat protein
MAPRWQREASRLHRAPGRGKELVTLLSQHARAGDAEAAWYLGTLHQDGFFDAGGARVLARSPRRAAELYRLGVARGHTSSMVNLATLLWSGRGVARDGNAALRLELRAARLGAVSAIHNVAIISYRQLGKHRTAYRWFLRAAKVGARPWLDLARAQLFGLGTRRDVRAAVRTLRRAERDAGISEGERQEARALLAWLDLDGVILSIST